MAERRVGLPGAVGIGVGSMLGAGVFVVWGPAATAAGSWLLTALVIAAVVAVINAGSTAQLAAAHPVAGGAYAYGRAELGEWPGFVAGLGFVLGKTASVAAIALAVGAYVWPAHAAVVATAAIVVSWLLNSRGVTRTAGASVVVACVVVGVLGALAAALVLHPTTYGWFAYAPPADAAGLASVGLAGGGPGGVAQAAALLFFAFAGYARVATLGEEVREPSRTIPRAIGIALAAVLVIYAAFALLLPRALGEALPGAAAPLVDAAAVVGMPAWIVAAAAVAAAFGSLLAVMAGVGRTSMAMARAADLPPVLARTNPRGVPAIAEAASALVAIALVWIGDLTLAIAMSSFAVLLYYAVANAAAARASRSGRSTRLAMPWWLSAMGLALCATVAVWLPPAAIVAAAVLLAIGVTVRALVRRR